MRVVANLAFDTPGPRRKLIRREHVVEGQHPLEVVG